MEGRGRKESSCSRLRWWLVSCNWIWIELRLNFFFDDLKQSKNAKKKTVYCVEGLNWNPRHENEDNKTERRNYNDQLYSDKTWNAKISFQKNKKKCKSVDLFSSISLLLHTVLESIRCFLFFLFLGRCHLFCIVYSD